jgi:hypothetical protein
MKLQLISSLFLVVSLFHAPIVEASQCPSQLQYSNGQTLKSGNRFYYNNGQTVSMGSSLYHANGQSLKSGSTFYHSNGQYFKSGSSLYYANGQYLRVGSSWYYENGQYLRSGSSFYYSNGQYLRSGTTLYRNDGSRTEFPITIRTDIGPGNFYSFYIERSADRTTAHLDRFSQGNGVTVALVESGDGFNAVMTFNTGFDGESVTAQFDVSGNLASCRLGIPEQTDRFRLDSAPASIDVIVKPGYDPASVRRVLQDALDSL